MNDIEKAIETLKARSEFVAEINIDAKVAYEMAISALEKQLNLKELGFTDDIIDNYKQFEDECIAKGFTLKSLIEAREKQLNKGWIPASERLPEIENLYLVQTDSKYGGSDGKGAMDIDKFSLDEDGSGYWNYWPNSHSGKTQVIAWQPLPESYKEEDYD